MFFQEILYLGVCGKAWVANQLAEEALSIPIFPELQREQLDEVIAAIGEWVA